LGTDIIVGFPGETEEDFMETYSLVEEAAFDQAFIFKYSQRRGTPASDMPDQLPQEIIEERHARLLDLMNRQGRARYEQCVGKTFEVLVEGPSKRNAERLMGRTRCNKIVVFEGNERQVGELIDLRIDRCGSFTLYGDPAIINLQSA